MIGQSRINQAETSLNQADDLLSSLNQKITSLSERYYNLRDQNKKSPYGYVDPLLLEIEAQIESFFQSLNSIKEDLQEIERDKKYREQRHVDEISAVSFLEDTIKELEEKLTSLQKRYEHLSSEHQELREKYKTLFEDFEKVKEELEEANNKKLGHKSIIEEEELEGEKESVVASSDEIANLKAELVRLRQQVKKQDTEFYELSKQNSDNVDEKEQLKNKVAQLESHCVTLQNQKDEINAINAKLQQQALEFSEKKDSEYVASFADELQKIHETKSTDDKTEMPALRRNQTISRSYNATKTTQLNIQIAIMSSEIEAKNHGDFVNALIALYKLVNEISNNDEINLFILNQQEKILSAVIQMLEVLNFYPTWRMFTPEEVKQSVDKFKTTCKDVLHPKEPKKTYSKMFLNYLGLFHEEKVDPKSLKELQETFKQPTKAVYKEAEIYIQRHFPK